MQVLQTRDGEQMVVAVGGSAWAGERPNEGESIINDIEGFGFVAEMVFPARSGLLSVIFCGGGFDAGLVGTDIVDIDRLWVTPGSQAAVFAAVWGIAFTTLFASFASRAIALRSRL